jgi:type IV pilus assembly protein PilM
MFEFLRGKKNHFIGIDFGTSSIKVVELSYKNQKASLENYGVINLDWMSSGTERQDALKRIPYEQRLGDSLKSVLARMKLKSGSAYVAIPGFSGLITIIELPEMQNEELTKAIHFEAHKYIPSSLDEIAMSWEVIEHVGNTGAPLSQMLEKEANSKKIRVLLVAAPKKDIELYDKFVAGNNLKVNAIELETFSLIRSLVGDDGGNFLIVDIGSRATNIVLVEKGIAIVNRNIDVGGNEITAAIADSMNISKQRAEDFKKSEKDILNSKESRLVIPALESIANESKRILNAYKAKNQNARIDGVLLSGGTSKMKGLEEYFTHLLETKVMLGNPWRRVTTQDNARGLVAELGGSFSVVLGLALRGLEEYKRE